MFKKILFALMLTAPCLAIQTNVAEAQQGRYFESRVEADWEGWDGKTIVRLDNGTIWEQADYYYNYHYAYRPAVIVYEKNGQVYMLVEGHAKAVRVTRLR